MNSDCHFWLNWWVNVAIAIATFSAVLVALFGKRIRAQWFRPKLTLTLDSTIGEKIPAWILSYIDGREQRRSEATRYYRIRVTNEERWQSATQTQVYLLRVEEPGPDNVLQTKWAGELPLIWTHQSIFPIARTIGPSATIDLCSVLQGKGIYLHPLIEPINFQLQYTNAVSLILSLQAKANEGESDISRFKIAWDGKWEDGDNEMAQHLIVKDITGQI